MSEGLSRFEAAKQAVGNPYAARAALERLAQSSAAALSPEDEVILGWHGVYWQRPKETERFTVKLRLSNGAITAAQLSVLARIAAQRGQGQIDITARQNLQVDSLALADLPELFAALDAAGLTTLGANGDVVRNVIGCPVAGLDADEYLDVEPAAQAVTAAFLDNPDYANLPRKIKVALCGCKAHCVATEVNDVGLTAARNAAGELGYALSIGGGLAARPIFATEIGWIAPDAVTAVVTALATLFRDHGNRGNRGRARLKFLLADWGPERFRAELEQRLGYILPPVAEHLTPVGNRLDHLGVHPQQEAGRSYIGAPIPLGRLTAAQAGLLASLAAQYGRGRLRVTAQHNLILADIETAQVERVLAALAEGGLPVQAESWAGRLMVCQGKQFCNKASTVTKAVAAPLLAALETEEAPLPIRVGMSGCPNGCAHHMLSAIGFQGTAVKGENGLEERFDLLVGGGVDGDTLALARRLQKGLRPSELTAAVRALLARYRAECLPDEEFTAYARRVLWAETDR